MSVSRVYYLIKRLNLDPNIADLCSAAAECEAASNTNDAEWTDQSKHISASISKRCRCHRLKSTVAGVWLVEPLFVVSPCWRRSMSAHPITPKCVIRQRY